MQKECVTSVTIIMVEKAMQLHVNIRIKLTTLKIYAKIVILLIIIKL